MGKVENPGKIIATWTDSKIGRVCGAAEGVLFMFIYMMEQDFH